MSQIFRPTTMARLAMALAVPLTSFLLSGCTTSMVSSRPVSGLTSQDREGIVSYSLPKTMVRIAFLGTKTVLPGQITVESLAVADPAHTYLLRYKANPFSDDKLTVRMLEGQPFISQVNGVATDRTAETISSAVEGIARATTFFADKKGEAAPPPLIQLVFDPHDPVQMDAARRQLGHWKLDVACLPSCPVSTPPALGESDGLYARATIPLELAICQGQCATNAPGKIQTIASYNASPLIRIPIQRTVFAGRETVVDFDQGAVRMTQHDKEAEAVAIAKLPGQIVGSLITGMIAGVQDRTAVLNAQKETLTAKKDLLAKRLDLLKKQREIEQAELLRAGAYYASRGAKPKGQGSGNFETMGSGSAQPKPEQPPQMLSADDGVTIEAVWKDGYGEGMADGYRRARLSGELGAPGQTATDPAPGPDGTVPQPGASDGGAGAAGSGASWEP